MEVYLEETEFPTYLVYYKTFDIVAANVNIDRKVGQRPSNEILNLLDTLDKNQVMSGTDAGLTLEEKEAGLEPIIKNTIITSSEEIKGALNPETSGGNSENTLNNDNYRDTETYIDVMNGYDWIKLTYNQKFDAVSNALFNLDQNGYTILESEYFYIDALNEFYSDSFTMDTPVSEVLASIGVMSNTIIK